MVASESQTQQFRTFQFLFANIFLHEVAGHLLVTYLIGDEESQAHARHRGFTPEQYQPTLLDGLQGYGNYIPQPGGQVVRTGESGRYLEQLLFGGTVEFIVT